MYPASVMPSNGICIGNYTVKLNFPGSGTLHLYDLAGREIARGVILNGKTTMNRPVAGGFIWVITNESGDVVARGKLVPSGFPPGFSFHIN